MRVSSAEDTEQTSSPSHTHQHSQLCTQHCQTLDLAPHVVRQLGKCSQGFEATSAEKTGARYGSTLNYGHLYISKCQPGHPMP